MTQSREQLIRYLSSLVRNAKWLGYSKEKILNSIIGLINDNGGVKRYGKD